MNSDTESDVVERLENIEENVQQLKDDISTIKQILLWFKKEMEEKKKKEKEKEKELKIPREKPYALMTLRERF